MYERSAGAESALTAICLAHLAAVYRGQKRPAEAEALLKQSIETLQKTVADDAPILAPVLKEYAQLLRTLNRASEGAPLEARARKLELANDRPQ